MTFSTAAVFSHNLLDFIDFYNELSDLNPNSLHQVGCAQRIPDWEV
jgi:hypothetical protein